MSEIKDDIQNFIKKMKDLYNILLSYLDNSINDEKDFNLLFDLIEKQKLKESKDEIIEFFMIVVNICNNHYRNKFFLQKIEKIISSFFDNFKQDFSEPEIFHIFKTNKRILYFLIQNQIITLNSKEMKRGSITYLNNFDDQYLTLKDENKCKIGENDGYICELIRDDLVENFIIYTTQNNIQLESQINVSKFETNQFLIDKGVTLIEYAAFFGSIQIFKYLVMNKVEIKSSIWIYAIHSNNPEIINQLEENKIDPDDETYVECLKESIKCHHNDVANYIKENYLKDEFEKFDKNKYCFNMYTFGFEYHNYEYFPQFIDFNFIVYACQFNHLKFVKLLLKLKQLKSGFGLYLSTQFLSRYQYLFDNSLIYYFKNEIITPSRIAALYQNYEINDVLMHLKGIGIPHKYFYCSLIIVKISIPSSIKIINSKAFFCCAYLREVTFESHSSLTKICNNAFVCCSFEQILIPSSVTCIEHNAFSECHSLKHISIPSSLEKIEPETFKNCELLETVSFEMPISLKIVGERCFENCTSMKKMWIPYSVQKIEAHAFSGCTSLKISIPNSLNSIGLGAFERCLSCDRF